jgi:hypothetical protein
MDWTDYWCVWAMLRQEEADSPGVRAAIFPLDAVLHHWVTPIQGYPHATQLYHIMNYVCPLATAAAVIGLCSSCYTSTQIDVGPCALCNV